MFARFASEPDGAAHADYLLQRLKGRLPRVIALDVECGSGDLSIPTLEFFQRCEARGIEPERLYVYTNRDFITNRGLNAPSLARYGLWLAAPGDVQPAAPAPWRRVAIWQNNWHGTVAGISGDVDLDRVGGA